METCLNSAVIKHWKKSGVLQYADVNVGQTGIGNASQRVDSEKDVDVRKEIVSTLNVKRAENAISKQKKVEKNESLNGKRPETIEEPGNETEKHSDIFTTLKTLTAAQVKRKVSEYLGVPVADVEGFIPMADRDRVDLAPKFIIIFTSKTKLRQKRGVLTLGRGYRHTWQGLHVNLSGIVKNDGQFRPWFVSICSNPQLASLETTHRYLRGIEFHPIFGQCSGDYLGQDEKTDMSVEVALFGKTRMENKKESYRHKLYSKTSSLESTVRETKSNTDRKDSIASINLDSKPKKNSERCLTLQEFSEFILEKEGIGLLSGKRDEQSNNILELKSTSPLSRKKVVLAQRTDTTYLSIDSPKSPPPTKPKVSPTTSHASPLSAHSPVNFSISPSVPLLASYSCPSPSIISLSPPLTSHPIPLSCPSQSTTPNPRSLSATPPLESSIHSHIISTPPLPSPPIPSTSPPLYSFTVSPAACLAALLPSPPAPPPPSPISLLSTVSPPLIISHTPSLLPYSTPSPTLPPTSSPPPSISPSPTIFPITSTLPSLTTPSLPTTITSSSSLHSTISSSSSLPPTISPSPPLHGSSPTTASPTPRELLACQLSSAVWKRLLTGPSNFKQSLSEVPNKDTEEETPLYQSIFTLTGSPGYNRKKAQLLPLLSSHQSPPPKDKKKRKSSIDTVSKKCSDTLNKNNCNSPNKKRRSSLDSRQSKLVLTPKRSSSKESLETVVDEVFAEHARGAMAVDLSGGFTKSTAATDHVGPGPLTPVPVSLPPPPPLVLSRHVSVDGTGSTPSDKKRKSPIFLPMTVLEKLEQASDRFEKKIRLCDPHYCPPAGQPNRVVSVIKSRAPSNQSVFSSTAEFGLDQFEPGLNRQTGRNSSPGDMGYHREQADEDVSVLTGSNLKLKPIQKLLNEERKGEVELMDEKKLPGSGEVTKEGPNQSMGHVESFLRKNTAFESRDSRGSEIKFERASRIYKAPGDSQSYLPTYERPVVVSYCKPFLVPMARSKRINSVEQQQRLEVVELHTPEVIQPSRPDVVLLTSPEKEKLSLPEDSQLYPPGKDLSCRPEAAHHLSRPEVEQPFPTEKEQLSRAEFVQLSRPEKVKLSQRDVLKQSRPVVDQQKKQETAGKVELVEKIRQDCKLATVRDGLGNYPIHTAVLLKNVTLVRRYCLVLRAMKKSVDMLSSELKTPLVLAVEENLSEIVSELLSKGADPSLTNTQGESPLHLAVLNKTDESLKAILSHCKARPDAKKTLERRNKEGLTPLQLAIIAKKERNALLLLDCGSDINSVILSDGKSSLELAMDNKMMTLYDTLVKRGASVPVKGNLGSPVQ